jgi:hypothetical protein
MACPARRKRADCTEGEDDADADDAGADADPVNADASGDARAEISPYADVPTLPTALLGKRAPLL